MSDTMRLAGLDQACAPHALTMLAHCPAHLKLNPGGALSQAGFELECRVSTEAGHMWGQRSLWLTVETCWTADGVPGRWSGVRRRSPAHGRRCVHHSLLASDCAAVARARAPSLPGLHCTPALPLAMCRARRSLPGSPRAHRAQHSSIGHRRFGLPPRHGGSRLLLMDRAVHGDRGVGVKYLGPSHSVTRAVSNLQYLECVGLLHACTFRRGAVGTSLS